MKRISIFGSTGSIGTNSLDIVQKSPAGDFEVLALTAGSNFRLLAEQAIQSKAKLAVIADDSLYLDLKEALARTGIKVASGQNGMKEASAMNNDLIIAGIVGAAGLRTTYDSIVNGADIALVNKESLVCAGKIMIDAAKKYNSNLIPTDSEHSAIFQCLEQTNKNAIDSITLTASGGPFRLFTSDQLNNITPAQAINHPKWKMGPKISADCATMMNKGLEIIEAHHLFDISEKKIKVLIHPESIIHSLVNYIDGSSLAQLGNADMRIPISYALYWPKRSQTYIAEKLDLVKIGNLSFLEPDHIKFPALNICRNALRAGTCHSIMLNASNEIALEYFLQEKIKFTEIIYTIQQMLDRTTEQSISTIEEVIEFDIECRRNTELYLKHRI